MLCGQTKILTHQARPKQTANIKEEAPRVEAPQVLKLVVRKLLVQNQAAAAVTKSFGSSSSNSSSSSETANIRGIVRAHRIRVPLSVGPGFAGCSGPLNVMMGYQASLQASPKTWQVQDESVTRVRKSMGKWADLCKSMAKVLRQRYQSDFISRGPWRTARMV